MFGSGQQIPLFGTLTTVDGNRNQLNEGLRLALGREQAFEILVSRLSNKTNLQATNQITNDC